MTAREQQTKTLDPAPVSARKAAEPGERPLCYCFDVTETDVRRYFQKDDATVDGLVHDTKIGTKCTACLLDLDLVLESCHRSLGGAVEEKADSAIAIGAGRGFIHSAADFTNSIFYVCDGNINTVVRVANRGFMFEDEATVVDHDYSMFVFSKSGTLCACRRGTVGPSGDLEIDLGKIPGIASHGWVLLALYPKSSGFRGSNRPYVTFNGGSWTASVHMQRHAMASRRGVRNVHFLTREAGGPMDSYLSVFNGATTATAVRVDLIDLYGPYRERRTMRLPRYGSELMVLDEVFKPAPEAELLSIRVFSDQPTRKMIVNVHADTSWSVDHFPDFPNDF